MLGFYWRSNMVLSTVLTVCSLCGERLPLSYHFIWSWKRTLKYAKTWDCYETVIKSVINTAALMSADVNKTSASD